MKKKNGFTLIELIVTIALILSVMVLAIIGFNNISKSKKEESFEIVKKTVESAATDYITSNKYLLETLSPNSDTVKVTLGTLVAEDYLDKVTNPINGNPLNKCSVIEITKENGGYNYSYDNTNIMNDCDNTNNQIIEVTDSKGPELSITPIGTKGNDGWYKRNSETEIQKQGIAGVKLEITAKDTKTALLQKLERLNEDGIWENINNNYNVSLEGNGIHEITIYDNDSYAFTTSGKKTCYRAINESLETVTKCINLKVDIDSPTCKFSVSGGYDNSNDSYYTFRLGLLVWKPTVKFSSVDSGSGINSSNCFKDGKSAICITGNKQDSTNGKYVKWSGQASDKAGNIGKCEKSLKVYEKTDPISTSILNAWRCGDAIGESNEWTRGNRKVTQEFYNLNGDTQSITKEFTGESKTGEITYSGKTCSVNTYIDRTAPTFSKLGNNTLQFIQYDSNKNIIQNRSISLSGSNGNYNVDLCLINQSGSYELKFPKVEAYDSLSGVRSTETLFSSRYSEYLGTNIQTGCLRTKDQNPCVETFTTYATDKVGNKGKIATFKIRLGYKNNGVSGHHYESWCNNW